MSNTVEYHIDVLNADLHARLGTWLRAQNYHSGVTKKGQQIDRKQIWFHRDECYFNPLWNDCYDRWKANKFPPILWELIHVLYESGVVGSLDKGEINSCLVNYYQDGRSFIPSHIDNKDAFGLEPIIINLSFGATRTLRINNVDYPLEDNTVLVMSGPSVQHELLRDECCRDERWSLTFRKHLLPT